MRAQNTSLGTALGATVFDSMLTEFFPMQDAGLKKTWGDALYNETINVAVAGAPVDLINRLTALYPGYTFVPQRGGPVVGHALARTATYLCTRLLNRELREILNLDDNFRVVLVAPSRLFLENFVGWCAANGKNVDIEVIQPLMTYDVTRVLRNNASLYGAIGRDGAEQSWSNNNGTIRLRVSRKKFQQYDDNEWFIMAARNQVEIQARFHRIVAVVATMSGYYFHRGEYSRVMRNHPHCVGLLTMHLPTELDVASLSIDSQGPNAEVRHIYNREEGYGLKIFWHKNDCLVSAYYADEVNSVEKPYVCRLEDWLSWYDNVYPGCKHVLQFKQAGQDSCRLIRVERAVESITSPTLFNGGRYMLIPNLYSVAKGRDATNDMLILPIDIFDRLVREINSRDVTALFKEFETSMGKPWASFFGGDVSPLTIFNAMSDASGVTNLRTSIVRIIGGKVMQAIAALTLEERNVLQAYLVYHSAILPHAKATMQSEFLKVRTRSRIVTACSSALSSVKDCLTFGYKLNHDPLRPGLVVSYKEYRNSRSRGNFDPKSNYFQAVLFEPRRIATSGSGWTLHDLANLTSPPVDGISRSSILGDCWGQAATHLLGYGSVAFQCAFRFPQPPVTYIVYCNEEIAIYSATNVLYDQDVPIFNFRQLPGGWHVASHVIRVRGVLGNKPNDPLHHDPEKLLSSLIKGSHRTCPIVSPWCTNAPTKYDYKGDDDATTMNDDHSTRGDIESGGDDEQECDEATATAETKCAARGESESTCESSDEGSGAHDDCKQAASSTKLKISKVNSYTSVVHPLPTKATKDLPKSTVGNFLQFEPSDSNSESSEDEKKVLVSSKSSLNTIAHSPIQRPKSLCFNLEYFGSASLLVIDVDGSNFITLEDELMERSDSLPPGITYVAVSARDLDTNSSTTFSKAMESLLREFTNTTKSHIDDWKVVLFDYCAAGRSCTPEPYLLDILHRHNFTNPTYFITTKEKIRAWKLDQRSTELDAYTLVGPIRASTNSRQPAIVNKNQHTKYDALSDSDDSAGPSIVTPRTSRPGYDTLQEDDDADLAEESTEPELADIPEMLPAYTPKARDAYPQASGRSKVSPPVMPKPSVPKSRGVSAQNPRGNMARQTTVTDFKALDAPSPSRFAVNKGTSDLLTYDRDLNAAGHSRVFGYNHCSSAGSCNVANLTYSYMNVGELVRHVTLDWRSGLLCSDNELFKQAIATGATTTGRQSIGGLAIRQNDIQGNSPIGPGFIKSPTAERTTNKTANYSQAYLEIITQGNRLPLIVFWHPVARDMMQAIAWASQPNSSYGKIGRVMIIDAELSYSHDSVLVISPDCPWLKPRLSLLEHVSVITGQDSMFSEGRSRLPDVTGNRLYLGPWHCSSSGYRSYQPAGLSGTGRVGLSLDEVGDSALIANWVEPRRPSKSTTPLFDVDAVFADVEKALQVFNARLTEGSDYIVDAAAVRRDAETRRAHNAQPSNRDQQLPAIDVLPGKRRIFMVDGPPRCGKSVTIGIVSLRANAAILAPTEALVKAHRSNGYKSATYITGQKAYVGAKIALVDEYQLWPPSMLHTLICACAEDAIILMVGNHAQPHQCIEKGTFDGPIRRKYVLSETRALGPLHVALTRDMFGDFVCCPTTSRFYAMNEEMYVVIQDENDYGLLKRAATGMHFIELTRATVDAANSSHTMTGTESTGSGFQMLYCLRVDARSTAMFAKGDVANWKRQLATGLTRGNKTVISISRDLLPAFTAVVDSEVFNSLHSFTHDVFMDMVVSGAWPQKPLAGRTPPSVRAAVQEGKGSMLGRKYEFKLTVGAAVQMEDYGTAVVEKKDDRYTATIRNANGHSKAAVRVGQAHLSPLGICVTGKVHLKETYKGSARGHPLPKFDKCLSNMAELALKVSQPKENLLTTDPILPEAIGVDMRSQLISCRLGSDAAAGRVTKGMTETVPVLSGYCLTTHPTSSYQQNNLSFAWATVASRAAYLNHTGATRVGLDTPVNDAEQEAIGKYIVRKVLEDYPQVNTQVKSLLVRYQQPDAVAELLANHEKSAMVKMIVKGTSADENRVILISDRDVVEDLPGPSKPLMEEDTEMGAGFGRYDPERTEHLRSADGLAKSQMKDANTYAADATGEAYIPTRDDRLGQPVASVNPARSKNPGYACGVVRASFYLTTEALRGTVSKSAYAGESVERAAQDFYDNLERNRKGRPFKLVEADESHKDSNYCKLVLSMVAELVRCISPILSIELMSILNDDFNQGWTIRMNKGFLTFVIKDKTGSGVEYTLDLNTETTVLLMFVMFNHRFHKTKQMQGVGQLIGSWWVEDLGPMIYSLIAQGDDVTAAVKTSADLDDSFTKTLRILHKVVKHQPGSYQMMYCNHICDYDEGVTYVAPHFLRSALRLYNRLYPKDMVQEQVRAIASSVRDRLKFGNNFSYEKEIAMNAALFGAEETLVAYQFLRSFANTAHQIVAKEIVKNVVDLATSDTGFRC